MSWSDRKHYLPQTEADLNVQQIDSRYQNLSQQIRNPIRRIRSGDIYNDIDARESLEAFEGFLMDSAQASWDAIRDTYDHGAMTFNQVRKVWGSECEDRWDVLFETALPAAGKALYLLLIPQPQQILENYLQPKALPKSSRSGKATRGIRRLVGRSGRRRRRWLRFPDVDQMIANNLPGHQLLEGRNAKAGTRWLFTGINVADRVLWYALLLDVTDTFVVNWSSNIMEARFCEGTFLTQYVAQNTEPVVNWAELCPIPADATKAQNIQCESGRPVYVDNNGQEYLSTGGIAEIEWTIDFPEDEDVGGRLDLVMLTRDASFRGQTVEFEEIELSLDPITPPATVKKTITLTTEGSTNVEAHTGLVFHSGQHPQITAKWTIYANP